MIPADKIAHLVFQPAPGLVELIESKLVSAYGYDVTQPWDKSRASGIPDCDRALAFKAGLPAGTLIRKHLRNFLSTRIGTYVHEQIQGANWGNEAFAEETLENEFMRGHSDLRIPARQVVPDIKTLFVDDFVDVAVGCRPQKTGHVVQANWYAVMHGYPNVALIYFNRNLKLTDHLRRSPEWQAYVRQFPGASETMTALTWKADTALARAADRKARRIHAHVEAGTLPEYAPLPEMLVPYKGECHFCEVRKLCHEARDRQQVATPAPTVETGKAEQPTEPAVMAIERWTNLMVEGKKTVRLAWQTWPSKVVGTTHRDDIPWGRLEVGDRLDLEWDLQNPNGPRFLDNRAQAIKVIHQPTGAFLGFLPATRSGTAGRVCWHLAHLGLTHGRGGEAFANIAELTGGTQDKANRGINIRITLCAPEGAVPSEDAPSPSQPVSAGH